MNPAADTTDLFDLLPDAAFCLDRRTMRFCRLNRAACEQFGLSREELSAIDPCRLFLPGDIVSLAEQFDAASASEPATAAIRTTQRCRDGRTVPVEWHAARIFNAQVERWIIVVREQTADRADTGEAAQADSFGLGMPGHDPLTGLPDRRLLERRLDQLLRCAGKRGERFAVCFVDLDGFKAVNDHWGHLIGDRVLCEVVRRLVDCAKPGDTAARFGGDEFIAIIDQQPTASEASAAAQTILDRLAAPMAIDDLTIAVTVSIGIAMSAEAEGANPKTAANLLQNADRAMYRAKSLGGGRFAVFQNESTP